MSTERRRAPRYQFVADAELLETVSGVGSKVKTGDLSIGGCFLDTLNPPSEGTSIQVTIRRKGRSFRCLGRVVFTFPRLGIGVAFSQVDSDQLPTLEEWLQELEREYSARTVMGGIACEEHKC